MDDHSLAFRAATLSDVRVGALKLSRSNDFYRRHGFVEVSETEWDRQYLRRPHL